MAEKDNFGSFLIGFLVGGLAGAVVALLYAPSTGEETRTVIKDKAIELENSLFLEKKGVLYKSVLEAVEKPLLEQTLERCEGNTVGLHSLG